MSGMVKAYDEIISVRIKDQIVSMTIAEKENQSGFSYNERLFILVHGHYFGYLSKIKMNEEPEKINIEESKVKIPIKNYYISEVDDNLLRIKFTQNVDDKLIPKEWVFRINSVKLAELWKQLLDHQAKSKTKSKSPQPSRKSITRKGSKDQNIKHKPSEPIDDELQGADIPRLKQMLDQPNNNNSFTDKPIQMTGSFAENLFDDDSEEEETSKRKLSTDRNHLRQSSSPPKAEKKPQPELVVNKAKQAQSNEVKSQVNVTSLIIDSTLNQNKTDQPEIQKSPLKKSRVEELNLPLIEQEPIEYTPNSESKQIQKAPLKSVNTAQYQRQPSAPRNSSKKPSWTSEDIKSKSITPEEKDIAMMTDIIARMDQKNEKFPFGQISYNHKQFQNWIKPYKHRLSDSTLSNPSRIQKIMNAVLENIKGKQERFKFLSQKGENCWIYRQITQEQTLTILKFKDYCQKLMKDLVLELYNHQFITFLKIKKENNVILLQYQDLIVKVPLIQLKSNEKDSEMKVLDVQAQKIIKKEFKAYKYLHQIIQNRGNLRVPLACLCEYGGITALFIAKAVYYKDDKYNQLLNIELNRLQEVSNLPLKKLLKDNIKPLNQFHYNEMRSGQTNIDFKFHFVQDIGKMFVYDLNQSRYSETKVLRMELIQKEVNRKLLPYISLEDIQLDDSPSNKKVIESLSRKIQDKIERIVVSMNNIDFIYVHPKELSQMMHFQGVNMRYLGKIYSKTDDQFMKSCLLSEIMARTIKKLLKMTFQDICLQQKNAFKDIQELDSSLKHKLTDFFNCLLGNNLESEALWKLVYSNAENYYEIPVETNKSLNKGQLIVSLAYHCSIEFQWKEVNALEIFKTQRFFKDQKIRSIEVKTKAYKPKKSLNMEDLCEKMKNETTQNFQWIVQTFNLKRQQLPNEIDLHDLTGSLRIYLSNFISPDQLDWSNNFSHLGLYLTDSPSSTNFKMDLMSVRWYLRKGNKHKYLNKFSQVSTKLSHLYGNNHLFLSNLYEQFSNYHKNRGEIEDSISFMKSSLLNLSAIGGDSNKLMTQKCFSMFLLLKSVGKEGEAFQYLKKAKKIVQNSPSKKVSLYRKIKLQMASKLLKQQKYSEALKELDHVRQFFQIYLKEEESFEEERARLYQLQYICFTKLNKKPELAHLSSTIESKLNTFQTHTNYESMLWIVVSHTLKNANRQNRQAILTLANHIKTKQSIQFYKKALTFLQKRSSENTLLVQFHKYLQKSSTIVQIVMEGKVLQNWQNLSNIYERESLFDFVSLIEEFIYLFGRDRMNSLKDQS